MGIGAKKPCSKPGCLSLVENGSRCGNHKGTYVKAREKQRPSARRRGYTNAWDKARLAFLIKHPFCKMHLERQMHEPATEVDHIIPHKGDMRLFWDTDNWQSLCKSCHSKKTGWYDKGRKWQDSENQQKY